MSELIDVTDELDAIQKRLAELEESNKELKKQLDNLSDCAGKQQPTTTTITIRID